MRNLSVLFVALPLLAQTNALTKQEIKDGWILLFDGKTMKGWTPVGEPKWAVERGAIMALPGFKSLGWIRNEQQFSDFELKLEFRAKEDANSGVFLRSASEGQPHVTGYELQIWVGNAKYPTGSLVNHASTMKGKFKGDVWNSYDVIATGDHFVVKLNGEEVLDAHDSKSKSGHIGMQSNQHKIEFRNIKVRELK